MNDNKKLSIWLPVIIALSVSLGIFIGNHYIKVKSVTEEAVSLQATTRSTPFWRSLKSNMWIQWICLN